MMKSFLGLGLALLPAAALATPVFLPEQDVAVSYELTAPGRAPADYQLSYDAEDELARIDTQAGYYVLANLPAGSAELVVPSLRAVAAAPDFSGLTRMLTSADGAQFTPLGQGSYAGLACRKYLVLSHQGTASVCLTTDGVILHFAGHDAQGSAEVTALSVAHTPQPAGNFAQPQGYNQLNLPPQALAALLGAN
jgi:hypothetical protein